MYVYKKKNIYIYIHVHVYMYTFIICFSSLLLHPYTASCIAQSLRLNLEVNRTRDSYLPWGMSIVYSPESKRCTNRSTNQQQDLNKFPPDQKGRVGLKPKKRPIYKETM